MPYYIAYLICLVIAVIHQVECVTRYDVDIKTSIKAFSGTKSTIKIRLSGVRLIDGHTKMISTKWVPLGGRADTFKTGSIEHIQIYDENIGWLITVEFKIFASIKRLMIDDWRVSTVQVAYNGMVYRSFFYKRLAKHDFAYQPTHTELVKCASGYKFIDSSRDVADLVHQKQMCVDVNECEETCNKDNMICNNFDGGYECECAKGYDMIGNSCLDKNECYDTNNECSGMPNMECKNIPGYYQCVCKEGFEMQNGQCVDINECSSVSKKVCDQICVNTVGSFTCKCQTGFQLKEDKVTCIRVTECKENKCNETISDCFATVNGEICICKTGYESVNGGNGNCKPRQCPALTKTDNHIIVEPQTCLITGQSHYGDRCKFKCATGYQLHKRSAKQFICDKHGLWIAVTLFAEDLHDKGMEPDRIYTPSCLPSLCPPLTDIKNGYVIPQSCTTSGIQHKGKCHFYCDQGYRLVGSQTVQCYREKFVTHTKPICAKIPKIECPQDITLHLPPDSDIVRLGDKYKGVVTNMPEEYVKSSPEHCNIYTIFPLGRHPVTYTASNDFGDEASCFYYVTVTDTSAPLITYCPRDLYYISDGAKDIRVKWQEPVFSDNTGIKQIRKSHQNDKLQKPTTFQVTYDASDHFNNVATCSFTVNIFVPTCSFDSIGGGDFAISKYCADMGPGRAFCTAQCPVGKTFHQKPQNPSLPNAWWCMKGVWTGIKRLPDCVDYSMEFTSQKTCPEGMIETMDYRKRVTVCGKCPRGTYYSKTPTPSCLSCPINTYQDEEGQSYCKQCGERYRTKSIRNIDVKSCLELCPPGTRSRNGVLDEHYGGCTPCQKNTYSVSYGSITCQSCKPGFITEDIGATSFLACREIPKIPIAYPSQEVTVNQGKSFHIDCVDELNNNAQYNWTSPVTNERHSIKYSNNGVKNSARYSIRESKTTDSGIYSCTVTYKDGKKNKLLVIIKVNEI